MLLPAAAVPPAAGVLAEVAVLEVPVEVPAPAALAGCPVI